MKHNYALTIIFTNAAPVSPLSIVLLSVIMILIVIIGMIIASMTVVYYKKKQKKKTNEYDYVETHSLPSNSITRDHIVATSSNPAYGMSSGTRDHIVPTSANPAYGMVPDASEPTQPTVVSNELSIEQTTAAMYEDIPL